MDAARRLCHAPGNNIRVGAVTGGMAGYDDSDAAVAAAAEPWLAGILKTVRRRWWLLPAGVVAALLLTLAYLQRADYSYSAELKVYGAPSSSGSRPASSALGGLAALAGLNGGSGAAEGVSPFRFYLDGLYSPEVARRMAADPAIMHRLFAGEWDARAGAWRQPGSLGGSVRNGIIGLLGLPQYGWTPPDATRLQDYIADNVSVRQSVKSPIVTIGYNNRDPAFAVLFLDRLHATTDSWLREEQTARTRGNIAYLAGRLETVTLAEQRAALVTALTEQERQAMLAHSDAPYAAEPFDVTTASSEPTRPRPLAMLIGAAVAGLVIGLALAIAGPDPRRWRQRPT